MLALILSLLLAATDAGQAPRAVVRAATRAVEGDSVPHVRARWAARVARDPADRAALLGLATLARLTYDYPAAERGYRGLGAGARDGYAVHALLGLAEGYAERRFDREAAATFDEARARAHALGDRAAEAGAVIRLAVLRGRLAGVHVVQAMLDTAAGLAPAEALDVRARLHERLAILRALQARPADARAEAESSIALARRAGEPRAEADGVVALAKILQYRGQWDSALVELRRSAVVYERAHDRSGLANSRVWYAQVLVPLGRYGEVREVMQRAVADGEATHNPGAVSDAHRALGTLATELGDWPAAGEHLERAAAISAATGDSSSVLMARKFQALVALVAGDVARARALTQPRLAWAERAGQPNEIFEAWRMLANVAMRERDWPAASRALVSARAQLPRLPGEHYVAWLAHDEARLALARGDLPTAERRLREFLRFAQGREDDVMPFDGRVRLADVLARRGDLAGAERELTAASDAVDRMRARLSDAELRTLAFQGTATNDAASAEPGALEAAHARVVAAIATGGRPLAAFDLAERWRARELADRLARATALRTEAPAAAASPATSLGARPRHAAEIVAALPDDRTALVEVVGREGTPLTMFVVHRAGVRARVVPAIDSLADRVARFDGLLESGADAARVGRELGAALIDPALPLLDPRVTRLVIVPDGPLHRLPFDALRLLDGRYVVERWSIAVVPSASVAATLWGRTAADRTRPRATARLLAFGDPTVGFPAASGAREAEGDAAAAYRAALDATGEPRRLEGAAREARLVARYAPAADVRLGADASAAFLKHAELRRYRVLHFATHALVDERSAARTALALAPGGGESGFVGPGDLAALRLDADLVVLSACRSAGGVVVGGEGVQGLTAPLLAAGARSVVATAWRIRDRSTVPFVDAFYAALARGLPLGDALRAAKLDAIRRGEPPRTWAAFLAIGDPLVTVPLRAPAPRPWWARVAWRSPGSG